MSKGSLIDAAKVRRIADLAHLSLSEEELEFYENQLEKILEYVAILDKAKIPPENTVAKEPYPERADEVCDSLPAEIAVSQASETAGSSFRVPRIIE